jgi:hypothetical protein
MGAPVVAAVDEKPAMAGRPHFPESDFLFTHARPRHWKHRASKRGGEGIGKPLQLAARGENSR